MKTIAVVNFGPIGDVLNAGPVCIEIKKNFPNSKLVFITSPISTSIAKCLPGVDKVILFDRYGKDKGLNIFKLALKLRFEEKIDVSFLLTDNFRAAMLMFLAGSKHISGRDCDGRGWALTHKIPFTIEEKNLKIHVSEQYMRVLKPYGLYTPEYEFGFNYSDKDIDSINKLISTANTQNKELIGLCPSSGRDFKDWEPEESAKLIDYFNKNTNCKVVIVGQKNASEFAEKIRALGVTDFLDFSCQTTIAELGALISKFKYFISVDSAPMHISFALNIPTIALFFQENFHKWGPLHKEKHRLIYNAGKISANEVIDNFKNLSG